MFTPTHDQPTVIAKLLSTGLVGLAIQTLLYPMDVARGRLCADLTPQGQVRAFNGSLLQCLRQTYRDGGLRHGLYRGFVPTIVGLLIHYVALESIYGELKARLPSDRDFRRSTWFGIGVAAAGTAATIASQAAVYPLDTVRRRLQVMGTPSHPGTYKGAWDCARTMVRTEGLRSLYRGIGVSSARVGLGTCVFVLLFDQVKARVGPAIPSL